MTDFLIQFRVRYAETDAMGIVHHAVYPVWFELGRTEFLRAAGLPYREMEARGIQCPVTGIKLRYRRPARYDDLVTLAVRIEQYTGTRLKLAYEVRIAGEAVCCGESEHAFLNGGRPCALQRSAPEIHAGLAHILTDGVPAGEPVAEVTIPASAPTTAPATVPAAAPAAIAEIPAAEPAVPGGQKP